MRLQPPENDIHNVDYALPGASLIVGEEIVLDKGKLRVK